jgi:hypothetical protein
VSDPDETLTARSYPELLRRLLGLHNVVADEVNPCGDYWLNEHTDMIPLNWETLTVPILYDNIMASIERDTSRDPGEGQERLW